MVGTGAVARPFGLHFNIACTGGYTLVICQPFLPTKTMKTPAISIAGRVATISAILPIRNSGKKGTVFSIAGQCTDCHFDTIALSIDRLALLLESLANRHALKMLFEFLELRLKLIHTV